MVLNTLQYLIVDEILLARVLVQPKVLQTEYRDDETDGGVTDAYLGDDDETEYDSRKARPLIA